MEREDKERAQATVRTLRQEKEEWRQAQDRMQTQIIKLEAERDDLKKIAELLVRKYTCVQCCNIAVT